MQKVQASVVERQKKKVLLPITQLWERRHYYKNFVGFRSRDSTAKKKPVKQNVEDLRTLCLTVTMKLKLAQ